MAIRTATGDAEEGGKRLADCPARGDSGRPGRRPAARNEPVDARGQHVVDENPRDLKEFGLAEPGGSPSALRERKSRSLC